MIQCPNCEGKGFKVLWDDFPKTTKKIDCGWCLGNKTVDAQTWIPYHPHRQRPKKYLDISLKNGSIVTRRYPNGTHIGGYDDDDIEAVRISKKDLLGNEQY